MVNLQKGQNVSLEKVEAGLEKLQIGLGWDTNKYDGGGEFDLDAICFLVGEDGKVAEGNDKNFVFFNNLTDPSGAVVHMGDNLTGEGEGDDEVINIDLSKISDKVEKVVFAVTIFKAKEREQNFGQIMNAFIRVVSPDNGEELIRYDLSEDYSVETNVKVAELYKRNGEWKFKAIGGGTTQSFNDLASEFGAR